PERKWKIAWPGVGIIVGLANHSYLVWIYSPLLNVFKDRNEQLVEMRQSLIQHNSDVVLGRERPVERRKADRRLQRLSNGGADIRESGRQGTTGEAHQRGPPKVQIQVFMSIIDPCQHGAPRLNHSNPPPPILRAE